MTKLCRESPPCPCSSPTWLEVRAGELMRQICGQGPNHLAIYPFPRRRSGRRSTTAVPACPIEHLGTGQYKQPRLPRCKSDQGMLTSLGYTGRSMNADQQDASKSNTKAPRLKQKYQQSDGEYELSRYKPIVQMVMEVSPATSPRGSRISS